jgi:hypothetical protein
VVSFTSQPLYPQGKSPLYALDRRLGKLQSRSGRGGDVKNSQPPPGIEPWNPNRLAYTLVSVQNKIIFKHATVFRNHALKNNNAHSILWRRENPVAWHSYRLSWKWANSFVSCYGSTKSIYRATRQFSLAQSCPTLAAAFEFVQYFTSATPLSNLTHLGEMLRKWNPDLVKERFLVYKMWQYFCVLLPKYVKQSTFSEADVRSASNEIPRLL